ncbi:type III pantothenate kinase [Marinobacterium sp. YM272]|uniref:type III pantothenate kinase n=1 Tax=Marinobacterium sp. YM272 TaxID=3421654 RepID=UPI003D7F9478
MILEIDVGNTFLKWRLREHSGAVVASQRVAAKALSATLFNNLQGVELVLVGSVANEAFNARLADVVADSGLPEPLFAGTRGYQAGVTNSYQQPELMGVDRWLAMLAAWKIAGDACCVVDCGSAITIDYLNARGVHQGGFILPGMHLLRTTLLNNTARVFVDPSLAEFSPRPGTSTSAAVTQGADFMFEAICKRVLDSLEPEMSLFVTGGDGELFHRVAGRGEWIPDLVLDGLELTRES